MATEIQGDIEADVALVRAQQRERWGDAHDREHTLGEWRVLIARYARTGRWVDVAALAMAAEEADRTNLAALGGEQ